MSPPIRNDSNSKSCITLSSRTAVSRLIKISNLKEYFFSQLELIEELFLKQHKTKPDFVRKKTISFYRDSLQNIRTAAKLAHKDQEPIQKILDTLTKEFKNIVVEFISEVMNLLGPPPVQWACIGMGSMSRREMCPYSDIEFAFLIEKSHSEALDYFRSLSKIIELKVINLGETKFPVFGELYPSPTPNGFCMDNGGNTPIGKPGWFELIDTPEKLAQFQSSDWMKNDIIVTNALSSVCYIVGNEKLVHIYHEAKEKQFNTTDGLISFTETNFRKKLAMKLLEGHVHEFKPDLSKHKQETNAFGIKNELYRPLQSYLGSLTLFCGLPLCSSFEMIQQLLQMGIFSADGAKNLTQALALVLSLRFEAHNFYQSEGEFLLHIEQGQPQDPHYLYLDEKRLASLHEIYKVLIPFHFHAQQFLSTQDPKGFCKSPFYDESPQMQGAAFEENLQYGKAHEALQQAVSLNPNDINAQLRLGNIEEKVAQYREAKKRHLKALALAQQKHGEYHPDVATSYNNIGIAYRNLGKYDKALEFCQKALKILLQVQILGEYHPDVAMSYNNIGDIYDRQGEKDKALKFYQKALKIQLLVLGENHPDVAISYNNIGCAYANIGEYGKALKFYQKVLKIWLEVLGENHPDIAISYNNIGDVYDKRAEKGKALEFYQKALKIQLQVLGENHPNVAISYNNIGGVYDSLEERSKALEFYQKALNIRLQTLGENHPDVITSYNIIGIVCGSLEEYDKAIESFKKALKIQLQIFGENHPDVATSYSIIGVCFGSLGKHYKALDFYQKALRVQLQVFGENYPDVAITYNNIANLYHDLGYLDKALKNYQQALEIRMSLIMEKGQNHDIVSCYVHIGEIYYALGDYNHSLTNRFEALKIVLVISQNDDRQLAKLYDAIATTYYKLKEYQKALENYLETVNICLRFLEEDHHMIFEYYAVISEIYECIGDREKAQEYYRRSASNRILSDTLKAWGDKEGKAEKFRQRATKITKHSQMKEYQELILQKRYPEALQFQLELLQASENFCNSSNSLDVYLSNIGFLYNCLKEYQRALEFYQKALKIRKRLYGHEHQEVANSYNSIGNIYQDIGEYKKALEFYQLALNIWHKSYGEHHAHVGIALNNPRNGSSR